MRTYFDHFTVTAMKPGLHTHNRTHPTKAEDVQEHAAGLEADSNEGESLIGVFQVRRPVEWEAEMSSMLWHVSEHMLLIGRSCAYLK